MLQANADASASMLRKTLNVAPDQLNALSFSWQVPQLIANADMPAIAAEAVCSVTTVWRWARGASVTATTDKRIRRALQRFSLSGLSAA